MAKATSAERIEALRQALFNISVMAREPGKEEILDVAWKALNHPVECAAIAEEMAIERAQAAEIGTPESTWAPQAKPVDEIFYSPVLQVSQVYRDNHERIFGKKG